MENFDPAVSDYTVSLNGTKPQVTAQASGHGVTTVVESSQDNLPSLVRLLAKDGSLVKEYRIHFKPSHRIVPEEGDQSPVLETTKSRSCEDSQFYLKKSSVKIMI